MKRKSPAQSPESFLRRNRVAEVEAKLDEADQRSFDLIQRLRAALGGNLEDELNGAVPEREAP